MIYEFCVSFILAVGASGTNAPRYVVILLSVDPDRPAMPSRERCVRNEETESVPVWAVQVGGYQVWEIVGFCHTSG
jgi:hypothetical protein